MEIAIMAKSRRVPEEQVWQTNMQTRQTGDVAYNLKETPMYFC